jgi:subtilisin family serine protease
MEVVARVGSFYLDTTSSRIRLPGYDFVSNPFSAADGDGWDGDPSDRGDGVRPREAVDRADCRSRVSSWHGTNVAGTIAAQQPSARPNLGIAPNSRIVPRSRLFLPSVCAAAGESAVADA